MALIVNIITFLDVTPNSLVDLVDSLPSNAHFLGQTDEM
jgi:hypothetical protein